MSFLADFCSFQVLSKELSENCHPFYCDDADLREFFASDFNNYRNDLFGNGPIEFYLKNGFNFIFKDMEEEKRYAGILDQGHLNTRLMAYDLILISS